MALEPPLTATAQDRLKQVREQIEAALEALVADMLALATAERDTALSQAQAEAAAALEKRVAEAQAQAAEAAADSRIQERQCDLACLERLLDAFRDLDAATSLSQVLDKLADHAAAHVARVAVLIVRDGGLRGWRLQGFGDVAADPSSIAVSLDSPTVVRRAVEAGTPATTGTGTGATGAPIEPLPFAPLPGDRVGFAVPLAVGVRTVAVLYADEDAAGERTVPSAWPEALEMLARHAACRLELLTLARAYGLHAQPFDSVRSEPRTDVAPFDVAQGAPSSGRGAQGRQGAGGAKPSPDAGSAATEIASRLTPPAGGRPPSLATDKPVETAPAEPSRQVSEEDASALRYARLLISEIKLYHEDAVNQGRRDANLLARLGPEIARARKLYEERVPADVRSRADYFGQELVRTLANGDPRLLGQAT